MYPIGMVRELSKMSVNYYNTSSGTHTHHIFVLATILFLHHFTSRVLPYYMMISIYCKLHSFCAQNFWARNIQVNLIFYASNYIIVHFKYILPKNIHLNYFRMFNKIQKLSNNKKGKLWQTISCCTNNENSMCALTYQQVQSTGGRGIPPKHSSFPKIIFGPVANNFHK